jgi:hypothetical protein
VRDALARYAGVVDPCLVPDHQSALDAALLAGRTLTESAPGSPARQALARLAARLAADVAGPERDEANEISATRRGSRRRSRR